MKTYITKLNKYKKLDKLTSEVIASTSENCVSSIRIYLDGWEELIYFDNKIEVLRPDKTKYVSDSLTIQTAIEDGINRIYIEFPIVSKMCELKGIYYLDLHSINGDKVFKSLNQIIYRINY